MIGFIGLFDTARDYILQFIITNTHISFHSHVFINRCSVAVPTADVPLPLASRTIPVSQLPASHSNSSQQLNLSIL
jgi:hypothetical protein